MTKTVFALLENVTARKIWREASQEALSAHPVVRGIIDRNLGFVCFGTERPEDTTAEHIIRVETEDAAYASEVLAKLPGVIKVASKFDALVA